MTTHWRLCLLIGAASLASAAEPADWSAWQRVTKFHGYLTVVTKFDTERETGLANGREVSQEVEMTTARFVLERVGRPHPVQLTWEMTQADVVFQTKFRTRYRNDRGEFMNHHQQGEYAGPPRNPRETTLTLFADTGRWWMLSPTHVAQPFTVTSASEQNRSGQYEQQTQSWTTDAIESGVFTGVTSRLIGPILFQETFDRSRAESSERTIGSKEQRLHLWPEFDDVEVEVTIEDYADWIPRGNLAGPQQAGNSLVARAVLKPKGDRKELPVRAKSFRFELADVTREPGVALNWPLHATDKEPDLQFAGATGDKLKTDVPPTKNAGNHDEATARIAAHDFGAAGMLLVICALEDGRSVSGFLRHEGRQLAPIPIPNRRDNSLIAAKWRREMKLTGSDAMDDDAEPPGNGCAGDGLSHYEEYRGFVIGGLHARTNPGRKDFFVLNQIGRRAVPGLVQFATITKLTTHYELLRRELPESRRMNANRSAQSPRSTAEFQHAVVLDSNTEGEANETTFAGEPWRPKTTVRCSIHPILFLPGRKPNEAASAIAHELLHSIGVQEHGDADRDVVWIRNEGGDHPGVWLEERPAGWSEALGKKVYSDSAGVRIRLINSAGLEVPAEGLAMFEEPVFIYLGEHQGKHSGVVGCVIRYDCANAFRVPARARDRFLKETEPAGMALCDSATGTEFNAPGLPLVRYGNAQRGNCQQHFCVRDDAPDP